MVKNIGRDDLKDMMDSGEVFFLVNVLDPEEFENERICGSINIPAPAVGRDSVNLLDKDDTIVLYCAGPSCTASAIAADKLNSLGFSDIWRFEGGLKEWKEAGYCVEGLAHEKAA